MLRMLLKCEEINVVADAVAEKKKKRFSYVVEHFNDASYKKLLTSTVQLLLRSVFRSCYFWNVVWSHFKFGSNLHDWLYPSQELLIDYARILTG